MRMLVKKYIHILQGGLGGNSSEAKEMPKMEAFSLFTPNVTYQVRRLPSIDVDSDLC